MKTNHLKHIKLVFLTPPPHDESGEVRLQHDLVLLYSREHSAENGVEVDVRQ